MGLICSSRRLLLEQIRIIECCHNYLAIPTTPTWWLSVGLKFFFCTDMLEPLHDQFKYVNVYSTGGS
jgi:hypothetical protein